MNKTKRFTFFVFFLMSIFYWTSNIFAQDYIRKLDHDSIKCKVTKVGISEIEYQAWDNLDGPSYSIVKSDVKSIRYKSGKIDVFNNKIADNNSKDDLPKPIVIDSSRIANEYDFNILFSKLYPTWI